MRRNPVSSVDARNTSLRSRLPQDTDILQLNYAIKPAYLSLIPSPPLNTLSFLYVNVHVNIQT